MGSISARSLLLPLGARPGIRGRTQVRIILTTVAYVALFFWPFVVAIGVFAAP